MKIGSFNKIYKLGNLIIKIDTDKDKFSNLIIKEMDSKKYIKYKKDLNKSGIKTSKIYFYITFPKTILVEQNIKGENLQDIMNNQNIKLKDKLILIKKLLLIYKKIYKENVCIDCNLKNFILNNDELVYIDFVPSLYKRKIKKVNNNILNDYKELYINSNIQLISILNYILKSLMYLPKGDLKEIKELIINYIESEFNINIFIDSNNVVIKKNKLLDRYIYGDMNKEKFNLEYQKINKR